jgi:hypothetical protein
VRTMMKVHIPVEKGNQAIRDGRMSKIVEKMMDDLHPEAAYFAADHGQRTMFVVFDLADSSRIPVSGEPFLLDLDAEIEFTPVMNAEDLQRGMAELEPVGGAR